MPQFPGCAYEQYNNGIHHFVITEGTKFAIDCWINTLARLYAGLPPEITVRVRLDLRVDQLPFSYLTQQLRILNATYPEHQTTRTAIIHDENFQIALIRSTMNSATSTQLGLNQDRVRVFTRDKDEEATHWLLEKDSIKTP